MYKYGSKPRRDNSGFQTVSEVVANTTIEPIPERGIPLQAAEHFRIRTELSRSTGQPIAHYFPFTRQNRITAYKKVNLCVGKKHPDRFTVIGDLDVSCDLFGQFAATGGHRLYITEGEYDAACLWTSLMHSKHNTKRITPNVTSIALGTSNAAAQLSKLTAYLDNFKQVACIFDSDKATKQEAREMVVKGQDALLSVALIYPKILTVLLPVKDCCQLHCSDTEQLAQLAIFSLAPYQPEDVITSSVGVELLMKPLQMGVYVSCLPATMRMLHGLRRGEHSVIIAPAGVGKSTVSKEIGFSLIDSGAHVGHILLEESVIKSQQAYIAMANNVPLAKFREDPSVLTLDAVTEAERRYINNNRVCWLSAPFGKLSPDAVLPKLRYMHSSGSEYIILDHIHLVLSGEIMRDERQYIDYLLTEITAFCEATRTSVLTVAHITRHNRPAPRGAGGVTEYPYWYELKGSDARGSGAFEQLAHNLLLLEPEILESAVRGRCRLKIAKNREWGWLGVSDVLSQDHKTGRLVVAG